MLTWLPLPLLLFKHSSGRGKQHHTIRYRRVRKEKRRLQREDSMAELEHRDTAIKLFGKTIPLTPPTSSEDEKDHESKKRHEISTPCSINKEEDEMNGKAAKKPDKILPCPRCCSTDTKFCYFNNYSVNQPRHFCKKCQRYWTAGGAMRNVPVGSGRRKSKSAAASGYRQILVSDSGVALSAEVSDSAAKPSSVLSFESAVSQQREHSNESTSATAAVDNKAAAQTSTPSSNGSPWVYPPCIPSSFFPIPFYPVASYWGCAVPWISPVASVNCSPTLGKRSRDDAAPESEERCIKEAAKSSIWAMMGVKSHKVADQMIHSLEASQLLLHANAAAMSRSIHFQESS